jgi:hypothetical protein
LILVEEAEEKEEEEEWEGANDVFGCTAVRIQPRFSDKLVAVCCVA